MSIRIVFVVLLAAIISTSSATAIDTVKPTVKVISPNGGEQYHVGSIQEVDWTEEDNQNVVRREIFYSTNGISWIFLSTVSSNTGADIWTVPADTGSNVWLKITVYDSAGNSGSDVSDLPFKIMYSCYCGAAILPHCKKAEDFGISTRHKSIQFRLQSGAFNVQVFDIAGRMVVARHGVASQKMVMALPVMASGACIASLEQNGRVITKRVMLQ